MSRHFRTLAAAGFLAAFLMPAPGASDLGAQSPSPQMGDRDFFLGQPTWTVTLRGGAFVPRAQSQFYDFIFERFTVDRGDLLSATGGVELGVWLGNHFEATGGLDLAAVTRRTEYIDWVEETDQGFIPIEQATRFRYGPILSFGVKAYPLGRGQGFGQFAWVPNRVSPFVSAGIGASWWALEQWGDWVVEEGENEGMIFTDTFESRGTSRITSLGAGVEISVRPRVAITLDTRYLWGDGDLSGDFASFVRPLDLSGVRATAGLSFRF
jgi:hypothetical protein